MMCVDGMFDLQMFILNFEKMEIPLIFISAHWMLRRSTARKLSIDKISVTNKLSWI